MKYYEEEAKELKELGEIPEHVKINEGEFFDEEPLAFDENAKEEEELDIDQI